MSAPFISSIFYVYLFTVFTVQVEKLWKRWLNCGYQVRTQLVEEKCWKSQHPSCNSFRSWGNIHLFTLLKLKKCESVGSCVVPKRKAMLSQRKVLQMSAHTILPVINPTSHLVFSFFLLFSFWISWLFQEERLCNFVGAVRIPDCYLFLPTRSTIAKYCELYQNFRNFFQRRFWESSSLFLCKCYRLSLQRIRRVLLWCLV